MITFRMATTADIQGSMALINQAKAFLKSKGVDQWQDGYPEEQDIAGDIAAEKGYVLTDGDDMIAYCCIDFGGEPAYEGLKGQWLADGPYVVIHRMAVSDAYKGKGLAKRLFAEAEAMAAAKGVYSVRVDTDEDNAIMRGIIAAMGFTYCGTIWFANSTKIAFQKVLPTTI
ncbi:GNAT family N-acetyltransferase [uncultured Megasphaera sp.]|uniref:GNAT family N-acetyltransferase n=1 Tax=uncultured Megasphaera sp. TaxID=165188 RepID=UPI002594CE25|nr:GNAT family N-acetyltransferase [uncultured Megasphaera sp.]